MFLLDTNVVSELRRPRPHGAVRAWMATVSPAEISLAAITIGEIQTGIEKVREHDLPKAAEIESWLDDLLRSMIVLPMAGETFRIWARLMHRKPVQLSGDAMLAATAIQHGLTVATRNTRDFRQFGVPLLNPFGES